MNVLKSEPSRLLLNNIYNMLGAASRVYMVEPVFNFAYANIRVRLFDPVVSIKLDTHLFLSDKVYMTQIEN